MSFPTPKVGVIGMGAAGPGLASAMRAAGHQISGVTARSEESRERAEAALPGVPVLPAEEVARQSEVLVLAVPDSKIEPLVAELVSRGAIRPGQVVAHLSGAQGLAPLAAAAAIGAIPIALHPAMTFTGTSLDVRNLQGTPVAYTAGPVAQPIAQSLIESIGGVPFFVEDQNRQLYHAALAHGSNHMVTLIAQASEALAAAGVDEPEQTLAPLARASLERAIAEGIDGLTGPVKRGDWQTVKAHRAALLKAGLGRIDQTYSELATATAGLLEQEPSVPLLCRTRSELLDALAQVPGPVGLVMTMGALHEGHLSLVREMKQRFGCVLVTIFVNPTQFGEGEDLDRYPRTLDADMEALAGEGADLVYAPTEAEVYPVRPRVTIQPGPAGRVLEGFLRPGHFAGVLLIVGKVFDLVRPAGAIFGQKDAQQFVNIEQMVQDLDQRIELIEAPIARDANGLALSSRNAYLSVDQLEDALALSRSLRAGADAAEEGAGPRRVVATTAALLAAAPGVEAQYVALADRSSFRVLALWSWDGSDLGATDAAMVGLNSVPPVDSPPADREAPAGDSTTAAYLLVAAKVGGVRLIDNMKVQVRDRD